LTYEGVQIARIEEALVFKLASYSFCERCVGIRFHPGAQGVADGIVGEVVEGGELVAESAFACTGGSWDVR
jgi:hypothetical protein